MGSENSARDRVSSYGTGAHRPHLPHLRTSAQQLLESKQKANYKADMVLAVSPA